MDYGHLSGIAAPPCALSLADMAHAPSKASFPVTVIMVEQHYSPVAFSKPSFIRIEVRLWNTRYGTAILTTPSAMMTPI